MHATAKLTEILFRFILLSLPLSRTPVEQPACWLYILPKLVISTQILPHHQKWLILFAVVMMTMQFGREKKTIYKF